jgi:hypothetical protein
MLKGAIPSAVPDSWQSMIMDKLNSYVGGKIDQFKGAVSGVSDIEADSGQYSLSLGTNIGPVKASIGIAGNANWAAENLAHFVADAFASAVLQINVPHPTIGNVTDHLGQFRTGP